LKATIGTLSGWNFIYCNSAAIPDGTGKSGFVFKLKTQLTSSGLIKLFADGVFGRSDFTIGAKLLDKNMVDVTPIDYYHEAWGAVWVPAGFDGYVYLPFSGATNALFNPAQIGSLSIGFIGGWWDNTVAYVDDISYYNYTISPVAHVNTSSFNISTDIMTKVLPGQTENQIKTVLNPISGVDVVFANTISGNVGTGATITVSATNYTKIYNVYKVVIFGDVNGDSNINVSDLSLLKQHLLKINTLSNEYFTAGDINKQLTISVSDLLALKKSIIGMAPISQG